MLHFRKVHFSYQDKTDIETAFRKSAIKRESLAKLELSSSNIGTDKLFFGYENAKGLHFMRIKASPEFFLPNVIFSLPEDENSSYYAFRLSTIATVLFFILCFLLVLSLSKLIIGDIPFESFLIFFLFFLLFLGLTWVEFKLTLSKINKAIKRQQ